MSAMLGSKSGVRRVAVVGLGKKDKEKELTSAALEAIGTQVGVVYKGTSICVSLLDVTAAPNICVSLDYSCFEHEA